MEKLPNKSIAKVAFSSVILYEARRKSERSAVGGAQQMKLLESSMSMSMSMSQSRHQHQQVKYHQPPSPQKCPRCESANTKFCYYNNYSLSQPRYFCKSCRRYWTHGGTLRNVPVGGGCRKSKRSKASLSSSDSETGRTKTLPTPPIPYQNSGISLVSMISPMDSICYGGGNISSLGASHPKGINQVAENLGGAAHFSSGFGGGGALNLPFLEARQAQPQESQAPSYFLPFQQNLVQPRHLAPRPGTFNTTTITFSATTSNFWNNSTCSETGPSNYSNQWHDDGLSYNPCP